MSEKGPTVGIQLALNPKSMKQLDIEPWLESCRKDKYLNPASDEKPKTESGFEILNPPSSPTSESIQMECCRKKTQIHLQLHLKGRESEADLSPVSPATTSLSQSLLKIQHLKNKLM